MEYFCRSTVSSVQLEPPGSDLLSMADLNGLSERIRARESQSVNPAHRWRGTCVCVYVCLRVAKETVLLLPLGIEIKNTLPNSFPHY